MTVLRNLPQQLILAHAPWLLGGALIVCIVACSAAGLVLVASGEMAGVPTVILGACLPLGIFALAIKRDQAIFDAQANTVTLQRRTLFSYHCKTFALPQVARAHVQELSDTYRPLLCFHDATPPYPLVEAYSSASTSKTAVDLINNWLLAYRRLG